MNYFILLDITNRIQAVARKTGPMSCTQSGKRSDAAANYFVGADVSPFSEERHSLLQRHGHLLPLHLAADAVRDVLPRVPPQVDIYCTYFGWCECGTRKT